jgi:1-deoxy-D-xylulose-5-phosphate synthase
VVAVYATFLNRAFDQVLMDVGLHRAGVTFVLDRAGVTGEDGASHHGVWDMSVLSVVPGLRLAAPRDAATLREELTEALDVADAPTVLRFPKGPVPSDVPAIERSDEVDVLASSGAGDVLLVSVGAMAPLCLAVAERLIAQGIGVTVVDPRWVLPVSEPLIDRARRHRVVAVVEDGLAATGVGSRISAEMAHRDLGVPVLPFGLPGRFLDHGTRAEVLADAGLTVQAVSRRITEAVARLDPGLHAVAAERARRPDVAS